MARQGVKFQLVPPNAIQFHFKCEIDTYDTSHYSAAKTEGRMPEEEVKSTLQAINAIRKPLWDRYLLAISSLKYVAFASLAAFIPYQIYIPQGNIPLILLGVISLIGINILLLKFPQFYLKRVIRKMRTECQVLVDQYNKALMPRGLRWYIPHYFPGGIELRKEYESLNPEETTGYAPPPSR